MDDPETVKLPASGELQFERIESEQTKLRRILSEVTRLLAEAQELIERNAATRH